MIKLPIKQADLIGDPFGHNFEEELETNDPRWPVYWDHLKQVQACERVVDIAELHIHVKRHGFKIILHGSRVMSWFITELAQGNEGLLTITTFET